jgi:predicted nucleotidyltransferase
MIPTSLNKIIEKLSHLPQVDCIVLGGSRAVGNDDELSDYDIYIYTNAPIHTESRTSLLHGLCAETELNNTFWDLEDDLILHDGTKVELVYVSLPETRARMSRILKEGTAALGYTTAVCFSVLNAQILHDPKGLYRALVNEFSMPYPEHLRQNIINKNWSLLETSQLSFRKQIEKSLIRNDFIMVTRRITGYMNSYFDIIFALNRAYVPGEKFLDKLAQKYCETLPHNFHKNLHSLNTLPQDKILPILAEMASSLEAVLQL